MKNELGTIGAAVGATALFLLFSGLALAIYPGWGSLGTWLNSAQGPAWIQAVGSIGALIATGWAVRHAHQLAAKHQREADERATTQLLEAVFQLVGGAHQVAVKIHDYIAALPKPLMHAVSVKTMHAELSAIAAALQKIDVTRLDRFEHIQAVLVTNAVVPGLLDQMIFALQNVYLSGETDAEEIDLAAIELSQTLKPFGKLLLDAVTARRGIARDDTFAGV